RRHTRWPRDWSSDVCSSDLEQHKIKVTVVARGIPHPWSVAFLPGGDMLVTERGGRLRMIRKGVLDPNPLPGIPKVNANRNAGLRSEERRVGKACRTRS